MTLIGGAIAQVFYQRSAEANVEGRLAAVVESVFRRLVSLGLFPSLLLILIGQDLFIAVFGDQWAEAGTYTQILSIYQFFNFAASPLGQLFSVLERQEVALVTNIALFLSRGLALWWGGQTGDIKLTLYLFSLSGVIVYGAYSIWLLISAGVSVRRCSSIVSRRLLISASVLGVCWLFCFALKLHSWSLLVVYGVGTIGYYGWTLAKDAELASLFRLFRLRLLGRS
jgi:O-antigen/teichoic acid export membrane protein